jgi:hypothetical protein
MTGFFVTTKSGLRYFGEFPARLRSRSTMHILKVFRKEGVWVSRLVENAGASNSIWIDPSAIESITFHF